MITVRDADDDDREALAGLLGELGYPVTPTEVPARLQRLRSRGDGRVLVAVADGGVVGFAALEITYPIHYRAPVAQVSAFAVAEASRRRGIGRRLLVAVEDVARATGCGRIVVTSAERRTDAHAFYVAAGWPFTGRKFARSLTPG